MAIPVTVGDQVRLQDGRRGEVSRVGPIRGHTGTWYSIILESKHQRSGSAKEMHQFRASSSTQSEVKVNRGRIETIVTENPSFRFTVGDRVYIHSKKRYGTIRFAGSPHFARGTWFGIELETPIGKNNGTVEDEFYFECEMNHGIFLQHHRLRYARLNSSGLFEFRGMSLPDVLDFDAADESRRRMPVLHKDDSFVRSNPVESDVPPPKRQISRTPSPSLREKNLRANASGSSITMTSTSNQTKRRRKSSKKNTQQQQQNFAMENTFSNSSRSSGWTEDDDDDTEKNEFMKPNVPSKSAGNLLNIDDHHPTLIPTMSAPGAIPSPPLTMSPPQILDDDGIPVRIKQMSPFQTPKRIRRELSLRSECVVRRKHVAKFMKELGFHPTIMGLIQQYMPVRSSVQMRVFASEHVMLRVLLESGVLDAPLFSTWRIEHLVTKRQFLKRHVHYLFDYSRWRFYRKMREVSQQNARAQTPQGSNDVVTTPNVLANQAAIRTRGRNNGIYGGAIVWPSPTPSPMNSAINVLSSFHSPDMFEQTNPITSLKRPNRFWFRHHGRFVALFEVKCTTGSSSPTPRISSMDIQAAAGMAEIIKTVTFDSTHEMLFDDEAAVNHCFVVLAAKEKRKAIEEAEKIQVRVRRSLSKCFSHLSVTFGLAFWYDFDRFDSWLDRARAALKEARTDSYRMYDVDFAERVLWRAGDTIQIKKTSRGKTKWIACRIQQLKGNVIWLTVGGHLYTCSRFGSNIRPHESENDLLVKQLAARVYADDETHMGNRRLFDKELEEICQKKQNNVPMHLFLIEIHQLGHTLSDEECEAVIPTAACVISESVGDRGKCFRIARDRFAVLLLNRDKMLCETIAEKIVDQFDLMCATGPRSRLVHSPHSIHALTSTSIGSGRPSLMSEVSTESYDDDVVLEHDDDDAKMDLVPEHETAGFADVIEKSFLPKPNTHSPKNGLQVRFRERVSDIPARHYESKNFAHEDDPPLSLPPLPPDNVSEDAFQKPNLSNLMVSVETPGRTRRPIQHPDLANGNYEDEDDDYDAKSQYFNERDTLFNISVGIAPCPRTKKEASSKRRSDPRIPDVAESKRGLSIEIKQRSAERSKSASPTNRLGKNHSNVVSPKAPKRFPKSAPHSPPSSRRRTSSSPRTPSPRFHAFPTSPTTHSLPADLGEISDLEDDGKDHDENQPPLARERSVPIPITRRRPKTRLKESPRNRSRSSHQPKRRESERTRSPKNTYAKRPKAHTIASPREKRIPKRNSAVFHSRPSARKVMDDWISHCEVALYQSKIHREDVIFYSVDMTLPQSASSDIDLSDASVQNTATEEKRATSSPSSPHLMSFATPSVLDTLDDADLVSETICDD